MRHLSKPAHFPVFRDYKDTLIVKSLFYPKWRFCVVRDISLSVLNPVNGVSKTKPFWTACRFCLECQIVQNLPNVFQRLITWAAKVFSLISQWNFCNFISQPLKLVIKLTVKMAFSDGSIMLASVCPLNLFSLRRCRVSYTIKTIAFGHLWFLCVWDCHLFLAPSASLLLFPGCGSSQILAQR